MTKTTRATILLILTLCNGTSLLQADMPTQAYYFVDIEQLQPLVLSFGNEKAEAFMAAISLDRDWHPVSSTWDTNRYQAVGCIVYALQELLSETAQQGDDKLLQVFFNAVNDQPVLVGHLWARTGGDFFITLALEDQGDVRWLRIIKNFADHRHRRENQVSLTKGTSNDK